MYVRMCCWLHSHSISQSFRWDCWPPLYRKLSLHRVNWHRRREQRPPSEIAVPSYLRRDATRRCPTGWSAPQAHHTAEQISIPSPSLSDKLTQMQIPTLEMTAKVLIATETSCFSAASYRITLAHRRYFLIHSGGSTVHQRPPADSNYFPTKTTTLYCTTFGKLLQPEAIFDSKCIKKHLVTGRAQARMGSEVTSLPQTS